MKATFNQKKRKTNTPTMQQRNRAFLETSSKHLEVMQQKTFKKHDNVLQKIDTDYTNHTYTYTKYIHTNVHLPPGTVTSKGAK